MRRNKRSTNITSQLHFCNDCRQARFSYSANVTTVQSSVAGKRTEIEQPQESVMDRKCSQKFNVH